MAFKLASLFVDISAKNASAKTLDVVKAQLQGVGSAASSAGGLIRSALAAAGVAGLGAGLFKAVSSASDLGETLSKVGVAFGPSAQVVIDQADQMSKAFGLSKQEMLDASASLGFLTQAAGKSKSESAELSNQFVKLAADLSSIANVSLGEAVAKISSGLRGEAEPLSQFGVDLSELAMINESVRLGLSKTGKDLDQQTKIMVRASLVTKGLAFASGDLLNTQDSTANQFRKLGGSIGNLATEFGTLLLPIVNKVIGSLTAFSGYVATGFEAMKPTIASFVDGMVSGFGTVIDVFQNFGVYWTVASLKFTQGIINIGEYLATLPENLSRIGAYIAGNWRELITDGINAVGKVFANLGKNIANLGEAIWKWINDPLSDFEFNWKPLLDGFEATAAELPKMLKPQLTSMQDLIDQEMAKLPERAKKAVVGWSASGKAGASKTGETAANAAAGKKEFNRSTMGLAEFGRSLKAGGSNTTEAKQLGEMIKANESHRKVIGELKKFNKKHASTPAVFAK